MTFLNRLAYTEDIFNNYQNLSLFEKGEVLYALEEHCYTEKPVDIETFIYDYHYLGNSLAEEIYPFWVDLLKKIHPHPCINVYNEVILSTSIGVGKSTASLISMTYEMYKLLCLKDPYSYYLQTKKLDKFAFSIMTPDKAQGSSVAFAKFLGMINTSPYFIERKAIPRAKSSVSDEGVVIDDSILVHVGSNINHLIGKMNFCCLMDEVSYYIGREAIQKAKEIHNLFKVRRLSRFDKFSDFMPGVLWLASSPVDEQDYLNTAIEELVINPSAIAFDNIPAWEVKGTFSKDTFKVFLGDSKRDPKVIDNSEKITNDMLERIIDVPVTYEKEFRQNVVRAIRDIAGRRVQADISLFKSKETINNIFINPNRFNSDIVTMSFSNPDDKLENYVKNLNYFKNSLHANSYRFIHMDISTKKDIFGLASVYSTLEEFDIIPTIENPSLPRTKRRERMYYVDFAIGLRAGKDDEINIFKVMNFLFLLKRMGYPIKSVSTDMFQGDVTRQFLKLNDVETKYLSVDRTKEPYYAFKDLANTGKIIGVRNQALITEILGLRDLEKKIDHPANLDKGISDAVVGSLWNCMNTKIFENHAQVYTNLANNDNSLNNDSGISKLIRDSQQNQSRDILNKHFNF